MTNPLRTATATLVAVLLVSSAVAPAVAHRTTNTGAASPGTPGGYAGSHVSVEATSDAVTNYSVDGEQMFSSMTTESRSSYESRAGVSVGVPSSSVSSPKQPARSAVLQIPDSWSSRRRFMRDP
jgi:hypothetical protein